MEYNHMEELGFSEDKQTVCTASGLLTSGNPMKRMCDRFMRNGGRLYDILTAFDNIQSFDLNCDDRESGDSIKTLVPLLKAAGVTDSSVHEFFVKDMALTPGSEVIHYMNRIMTTSIVSEAYEHHAMALCDSLKLPADSIHSTNVSFDELEMEREEAKRFREFAANISKMDIPRISSNGSAEYIGQKDQMIMDTVDEIIAKMDGMDFMYQIEEMRPIGGNGKALSLMEMRRKTEVDLECTAYIGNNATDYPAMDIIRDNDGLALAFNGDSYAVRRSNVAVMSPNSTVAAVLISEFYAKGLEGVYSLIGSWDRDKLSKIGCSDRHLMNAMLKVFPSKLPEVMIVDDDNADVAAKESERYRRKFNL